MAVSGLVAVAPCLGRSDVEYYVAGRVMDDEAVAEEATVLSSDDDRIADEALVQELLETTVDAYRNRDTEQPRELVFYDERIELTRSEHAHLSSLVEDGPTYDLELGEGDRRAGITVRHGDFVVHVWTMELRPV